MENQNYFNQALSNFMFDVASGGAIRHLADLGYTVDQIRKHLDFPTPYDRIQKTVWEHFVQTGVICLEEPGIGVKPEEYEYVTEYDSYGRKSFRRVAKGAGKPDTFEGVGRSPGKNQGISSGAASPGSASSEERRRPWREEIFLPSKAGSLASCLAERCAANGEETAYISCDFGLKGQREAERFQKALALLEVGDREYVLGLPWERRMVYHRLDQRMRRIAACLYEGGELEGVCYFLSRRERLKVTPSP